MRVALRVGAFLVLATLFIGFLHTRSGHPLLMKLAGVAGCPVGVASASQIETGRRKAVAKARGSEGAPARPALGFTLETSLLADVRAWSQRAGVTCTELRQGTYVSCENVPAAALGRPAGEVSATEVVFAFAPSSPGAAASAPAPLVSLTALYNRRTPAEAAVVSRDAGDALVRSLGAPQVQAGSFDQAGSTATVGYRFRDYLVDLTTTPIPGSGSVVRELYAAVL